MLCSAVAEAGSTAAKSAPKMAAPLWPRQKRLGKEIQRPVATPEMFRLDGILTSQDDHLHEEADADADDGEHKEICQIGVLMPTRLNARSRRCQ